MSAALRGDPAVTAALEAASAALQRRGVDRRTRFGALSRLARRAGARLTRAQYEQQREAMQAMLAALEMVQQLPERQAGEGRAAMAMVLAQATVLLQQRGQIVAGDDSAAAQRLAAFLVAPAAAPAPEMAAMPAIAEVQTDAGPLLIAAHDSVIRGVLESTGAWEPEEGALLRTLVRPGDTVLDIGAHVGYHTAHLSALVGPAGRVVAVEADAVNGTLLAANLVRNRLANVFVVRAAAFDRTTTLGFRRDVANTGDNRVLAGGTAAELRVPAVRLDDVLPADLRVAGIKCDVQGADQRALAGLQRSIARHRPWIVVEFAPYDIRALGDEPAAVIDGYRAMGYAIGVLDDPSVPRDASAAELVRSAEAARDKYVTLHLQPI